MRGKLGKRVFSMLMAAVVAFGSINVPARAASAENAAVVTEADAREVNFNKDWRFHLGDASDADQAGFDDSGWEGINLPHDFSITQEFSNDYEAESGFLPGGTGWYRKSAVFPETYAGKTVTLNFDGVYSDAYVYINGTYVGEHHYGYTDFAFDITDLITCDGAAKNVIAVKAVNDLYSSRWYSGSGIYRDVTLTVADPVHVAKNGTYVTTPDLETQKGGAVTVNVDTMVQNDGTGSVDAQVRTTVLDAQGNAVSDPAIATATVAAGVTAELTQTPTVSKPQLWSCDNPVLYDVKTEVLVNNTVTDTYTTEFGFRYIEYSPTEGFLLNGENVKLKGVCMHHDQGALGSAACYDAIYRQVKSLKEMGCNAIRTSHNVYSKSFISICNELGILVMEEIFDGWTASKNGNSNDFGKYFNQTLTSENQVLGASEGETWAKFVLESAINRDRNDPSIIMWSIGNELPTGTNNNTGDYPNIAANLISWIQALDDTKPITMGDNQYGLDANDFRTNIDRQLAAAGGVIGLNYYPAMYAGKHSSNPTWPLVGTETASVSNSRGIYSTATQSSGNGNYQCTAYDTNCVGWGNVAREAWYHTAINDFISGEFVWTGYDYIGEPTPWNGTTAGSVSGNSKAIPNSSYFGIIDTAGFPKDSYYFYTSQWIEEQPTLHIVPGSWNEEDLMVTGGKVPVYLYSNAAKVELYLNDALIGTANRQEHTTAAGYTYGTYTSVSNQANVCDAVAASGYTSLSMQFNVKYEKGTISAKAYDESGNLINEALGTDSVTTNSDKGAYLNVMSEKTEIQADGASLCYVSVDVMDGEGQFVSAANQNIRFNLMGNGVIVGVDNGNPSTVDKFQQKSVLTSDTTANINAFSGKALVIVRSTESSGGFTLNVESTGLTGGQVTVDTVGGGQTSTYLKDYDLQKEYTVEMGTAPVLQTEVTGTMSDGTPVSGNVAWDEVTEEMYGRPGDYEIHGLMSVSGQEIPVTAYLHVSAKIAAVLNYSRATSVGIVPSLPDTVSGILPNGELFGDYSVEWGEVSQDSLSKVGDVATVKGTAAISDGVTLPVTATIRVAEGETTEVANVAPAYKALTENCDPVSDNLLAIVDGGYDGISSTNSRWTNYNSRLLNSAPAITFTWDDVHELDHVDLYFFVDGYSANLPDGMRFEVSTDGVNYNEAAYTQTEAQPNDKTTFTFDKPQKAVSLRITMTEKVNSCVGLSECEIYTSGFSYEVKSTAVLDTLTVDGEKVQGFVSGEFNEAGYAADVENVGDAVTMAGSRDNASVTVVPVDADQVVRILVRSEDQALQNVYTVKLEHTGEMPDAALLAELAAEITKAGAKKENDYTADSYAALKTALQAARNVQGNENAEKAAVQKALADLQKALGGLVEKADSKLLSDLAAAIQQASGKKESDYTAATYQPLKSALQAARNVQGNANAAKAEVEKVLSNLQKAVNGLAAKPAPAVKLPKKGSTHRYKNAWYKVTKSAKKGGTVTYVKPRKNTYRTVTIPSAIKINKITFKVTAIEANAFKSNKKLAKVTISKYVRSIGKTAFWKDSRLKSIVIKSSVLKTVKSNALKGINSRCRIKVPSKKLTAYKRLLKKKGQTARVKIVK